MKGLEIHGRAEGQLGHSKPIEEYAGTAAVLSHPQMHMLRWTTSVECRRCMPMKNYRLTSLNYAIDLHQQHVKDNTLGLI